MPAFGDMRDAKAGAEAGHGLRFIGRGGSQGMVDCAGNKGKVGVTGCLNRPV